MTQPRLFRSRAVLLALCLSASPAMAYELASHDMTQKDQAGGYFGIGLVATPDYEGSNDYEGVAAPFGEYRWGSGRYVGLGGTGGTEKAGRLRANIISSDQSSIWEFGPLLQFRLGRDTDDSQVDNLEDRDGAVEAGAFVGISSGPWAASVSFAGDISDEHDGYLVYLDGSYEMPVNEKFRMKFGTHLTWADDNYMEDYFGVTPLESAKTGLDAYKASSGFKDIGISMTGLYMLNREWMLGANLSYTRMINDSEDSPVVDDAGDKNQFSGVIAAVYVF